MFVKTKTKFYKNGYMENGVAMLLDWKLCYFIRSNYLLYLCVDMESGLISKGKRSAAFALKT